MFPGEIAGFHYLTPDNPNLFPANFSMMQNINMNALQNVNGFFKNFQQSLPPLQDFTPQQSSSLSNNSTSDEAEDHQVSIIDERKQRRMISNRESARRSRMRKQKHLDELWSQVLRLRNENHTLIDKLNNLSESHDRVVQENAKLKEETSDLRQMLTTLQIGSPFNHGLRDCLEDDIPCNTAHLRAESSSTQSITNSLDLLH